VGSNTPAGEDAAMPSPSIAAFLAAPPFAVVGASTDRDKYGNKVLRCYLQHGLPVVGVNKKHTVVEGAPCFAALTAIPAAQRPLAVSVVAPPAAAMRIVDEAVQAGVQHLWFQPGAEDPAAIAAAEAAGIAVLAGGPCLLVALGFRDE
jgi:predicted CoA-binding protein